MTSYEGFKQQVEQALETQIRTLWATVPYATHLFDDQTPNPDYLTYHQIQLLHQYELLLEPYMLTRNYLINNFDFNTQYWSHYIAALQEKSYTLLQQLKPLTKESAILFQATTQLITHTHKFARSHNAANVILFAAAFEWQQRLINKLPYNYNENDYESLMQLLYQVQLASTFKPDAVKCLEKHHDIQKNYFQELYLNTMLNSHLMQQHLNKSYPVVSTLVH